MSKLVKRLLIALTLFCSFFTLVEDMPIFSEDEIPDKYYFDVTGKDKDGRGHTVTVQVDKKAYDHHKVGDYWRITVKR